VNLARTTLDLLSGLLPHYLYLYQCALDPARAGTGNGALLFEVSDRTLLNEMKEFLEGQLPGLWTADKLLMEQGTSCLEITGQLWFSSARYVGFEELRTKFGKEFGKYAESLAKGASGFLVCLSVPVDNKGETEHVVVCERAEVLEIAFGEEKYREAIGRAVGAG
jgi:hypothetical protein